MSSALANRVLRKLFGPKKRDGEQQTGEKFYYGGLLDLYSSPHIIRSIKLKTITWAVHVACMGRTEIDTEFSWRNLK